MQVLPKDSCLTMFALRIRVRKSAIGSVMTIDLLPPSYANLLLPASFLHAGNLTFIGKFAEANTGKDGTYDKLNVDVRNVRNEYKLVLKILQDVCF